MFYCSITYPLYLLILVQVNITNDDEKSAEVVHQSLLMDNRDKTHNKGMHRSNMQGIIKDVIFRLFEPYYPGLKD